MANTILRIGTRESPLAVWQAQQVQQLLAAANTQSELVYIKSEGDTDTITPLYALGVQGIFTKTLDAALLNNKIDVAVHSMKDVPVQLAEGIKQAAVLKRGNWKDIFVYKDEADLKTISSTNSDWLENTSPKFTVATSSLRRISQWLNRYPHTTIENLRGNVNTRLRKLKESNWDGAIFAAAGLERINLRPENAVELDWMLPAPAQGAIVVVCREGDNRTFEICQTFNDDETALCTKIERDFLKELMGGCSTPIGAIAEIKNDTIHFKANILSVDGKQKAETSFTVDLKDATELGKKASGEILKKGGQPIFDNLRNAK
jgi:hydroxymethylbilane synthase